jgi:hypothetical protein
MSFANMSPADRMKASGLIGLIVVILFFVVHIFLGAIAPKKTNTAPAQDPGAGPGVSAPPAPAGGPSTPGGPATTSPDSGFPTDKIAMAKSGTLAKSLEKEIPDPFVPISPKDKPGQVAAGPRPPDSGVGMHEVFNPNHPVGAVPPDTIPYGPSPLPAMGGRPGAAGPFGPAAVTVVKVEPEIKVVGLVDGDPPIATITVAGRSTLAHRGDALANGYRVMDISPDGVVIRCGTERKTLRVGGVVNEKSDTKAEAH